MNAIRTATACALGMLAWASAAAAQQVYWTPPEGLGAGQRGELELVFEDSAPRGAVTLPHVDGLSVLGQPSQSTNLSIVNGRRSSSVTLSFPVRADHTGTLQIPEFTIDTDSGPASVEAVEVAVGRAALRAADGSASPIEDAVQARLTPSTMSPYAGEVFDLELSVALTGTRRGEVIGAPASSSAGIAAEPWSEGRAVRTAGGSAVRFHTRAVAPTNAGRIELAPATQDMQIESGRARGAGGGSDPFAAMRRFGGADLLDSLFSRPQMSEASVASNAVQLDVQPLPAPEPADFSGAVGQFTLESTLTPEAPQTGEPVTWTLRLSGTGNWPSVSLPARAVPADLRTLQPKPHSEFADGERFHGAMSEDLVLVPSQPGELALAPVRFVFFNPASGQYETAEARPPLLHISGAPIAQPLAQSGAAAQNAPAVAAAAVEREPLTGVGVGHAPLPRRTLMIAAAAPFAALFAAWLALLAWRAWSVDPRRATRRTRRAMRAAIAAARRAGGADERIAALLAWQHHAASLMGIDLAAPTTAQLRQLDDSRWAAVWADSERALYRREHVLPLGWCDGALTLCAPPPAVAPAPRPGGLRRLVLRTAPALLLLALALLWLARAAHADERPQDSAAPSAGAAALAQVQARPLDWVARYNLGLTQAAEQRPG
ncbi:MAG: BatD family protein, partial [bacterium]